MLVVNKTMFSSYVRKHDKSLKSLLKANEDAYSKKAESHKWHLCNPQKRLIYYMLYNDLLTKTKGKNVLDIGGGYTSLSKILASRHNYTLIDCGNISRKLTGINVIKKDWYEHKLKKSDKWDVVIANDIFPNVDQRLSVFLDTYLPRCNSMRLSLTYHNTPKFYRAKRIDGTEILTMVPWNGRYLEDFLLDLAMEAKILSGCEIDFNLLYKYKSIFKNGRQVCLVDLIGGLK